MAGGNQIGQYLVTPDELGDPYQLEATVTVNGQPRSKGSAADIGHCAEAVFAWLEFIAPLEPGSAMGPCTIPDCTGLGTPYNPGHNAALQRSHLPRDPR